jgi:hypothetical protein
MVQPAKGKTRFDARESLAQLPFREPRRPFLETESGRVNGISFRVVSIAVFFVVMIGLIIWANVSTRDFPDDEIGQR